MMKKILSLLFVCLPITMTAQSEGQYLEGAVPVVDGKVIFSTEMSIESMRRNKFTPHYLTGLTNDSNRTKNSTTECCFMIRKRA